MLLLLNIDEFKGDYVCLGERTVNNVIQDSEFCRVSYSSHAHSINGIYIYFTVDSLRTEKNFNKTRIKFGPPRNLFIRKFQAIEELILKKIEPSSTHVKHIGHQMEQGLFKVLEYHGGNSFALKISGAWVNKYECGLTYRFISIDPVKTALDLRFCSQPLIRQSRTL